MFKAVSIAMLSFGLASFPASADSIVVAIPSVAGQVNGTAESSDAFIWRIFVELVTPTTNNASAPVVFDGWASDLDTFSQHPRWPNGPHPLELHASVLAQIKNPNKSISMQAIDEPCKSPPGAAVGAFPTDGSPKPCIAEQVARNQPMFNYIVSNNLNTKAGLAKAYAANIKIEMPDEQVAIKADWIPVADLLKWVPALHDLDNVRHLY